VRQYQSRRGTAGLEPWLRSITVLPTAHSTANSAYYNPRQPISTSFTLSSSVRTELRPGCYLPPPSAAIFLVPARPQSASESQLGFRRQTRRASGHALVRQIDPSASFLAGLIHDNLAAWPSHPYPARFRRRFHALTPTVVVLPVKLKCGLSGRCHANWAPKLLAAMEVSPEIVEAVRSIIAPGDSSLPLTCLLYLSGICYR